MFFIVNQLLYSSKQGAGHKPGWLTQFLHWHLLSLRFPFFVHSTLLFWELAFFSVGGITSKKCLPILEFSDKLLSE